MDYNEFLERKKKTIQLAGLEYPIDNMNTNLYDFQKLLVSVSLKKGKYALFEECGLGKTIQQLEWARIISEKENKPVLVIAPLGVNLQTIQEGEKFGIEVKKFDRKNKIQITNYENLHNINVNDYIGVVLDESSILKNFAGKIKEQIIILFKNTKYKLCCTATPSPNDSMELGNHAEFLNISKRNEMLSEYFIHDGGSTQSWRLKRHGVNHFFQFINEWAKMIGNPSDLGFDGNEFKLPKLNIQEVKVQARKRENNQLFDDMSVNATEFNKELRENIDSRIEQVMNIVNPSDNYIIWIKQNIEADILKKHLPDAVEVRGSESPEIKEEKLIGFAKNKYRILITKPKIAQYGLNYQNCHNQIFMSLDFSFESTYQAIRRSYRFKQLHDVNVYLLTLNTMQNVINAIEKKEKQFRQMQKLMIKNMETL